MKRIIIILMLVIGTCSPAHADFQTWQWNFSWCPTLTQLQQYLAQYTLWIDQNKAYWIDQNKAYWIQSSVTTSDSNANMRTQLTYNYLVALPSNTTNHILSGQFTSQNTTDPTGDFQPIYSNTGKYPALIGIDYAWPPPSDADIAHWAGQKGIIEVGQHFNNPVTGGNSYDRTAVDLVQLVTEGTDLNTTFKGYLDGLAIHLKFFQSCNMPVILRLFHEMNTASFWWGEQDPAQFKGMWIYTFNYLITTKGVHNIIWDFSPYQADSGPLAGVEYYPGKAYTDIVGVSSYGGQGTIPTITNIPDSKPFAFNEYGWQRGGYTFRTDLYPPVDISSMIVNLEASMPTAIYWMNWNGIYSMAYNSGITTLFADPNVITRDEIPNI